MLYFIIGDSNILCIFNPIYDVGEPYDLWSLGEDVFSLGKGLLVPFNGGCRSNALLYYNGKKYQDVTALEGLYKIDKLHIKTINPNNMIYPTYHNNTELSTSFTTYYQRILNLKNKFSIPKLKIIGEEISFETFLCENY